MNFLVDGIRFGSITEAAKEIGLPAGALSACKAKGAKEYDGHVLDFSPAADVREWVPSLAESRASFERRVAEVLASPRGAA